jgi:hypothetical protein
MLEAATIAPHMTCGWRAAQSDTAGRALGGRSPLPGRPREVGHCHNPRRLTGPGGVVACVCVWGCQSRGWPATRPPMPQGSSLKTTERALSPQVCGPPPRARPLAASQSQQAMKSGAAEPQDPRCYSACAGGSYNLAHIWAPHGTAAHHRTCHRRRRPPCTKSAPSRRGHGPSRRARPAGPTGPQRGRPQGVTPSRPPARRRRC